MIGVRPAVKTGDKAVKKSSSIGCQYECTPMTPCNVVSTPPKVPVEPIDASCAHAADTRVST